MYLHVPKAAANERAKMNKHRWWDNRYPPCAHWWTRSTSSSQAWRTTNQDPRIDRRRWLHNKLGCTTGGKTDEVHVVRACRSFQQRSWRSGDPACWQKQEERRREAHPRLAFCATHPSQRRYDQNRWNRQQRSGPGYFDSSGAKEGGSYPGLRHPKR